MSAEDAWQAIEQADKEKDVDDLKKVRSERAGQPHLRNRPDDAATAC
jgi:hypothetical protein